MSLASQIILVPGDAPSSVPAGKTTMFFDNDNRLVLASAERTRVYVDQDTSNAQAIVTLGGVLDQREAEFTALAVEAADSATIAADSATIAADSAAIAAAAINPLWLGAGIPPTTILPTFQWRPGREDMPSIVTATRASIATRTNELGLIEQVAANVMREDFDPITGECLGLLIEEQRTNLLPYSEDFGKYVWVKEGVLVNPNSTTAPDGSMTADKIVESSANEYHTSFADISISAKNKYSFQFFMKAGERSLVRAAIFFTGLTIACDFDLSAVTATVFGSATNASIRNVGNGWYLCSFSFDLSSATFTVMRVEFYIGNNSYLGVNGNGLYIWGAQLEAGAFPTSYIATASAAVTRSADVITVPTSAFAFNPNEGTLYADADFSSVPVGTTNHTIASINDGATLSCIYLLGWKHESKVSGVVNVSGSWEVIQSGPGPVILPGVKTNAAIAYKVNDVATSVDGTTGVTDLACSIPTGLTRLELGSVRCVDYLCGHLRHIAYFPRRISNSQLQLLTA